MWALAQLPLGWKAMLQCWTQSWAQPLHLQHVAAQLAPPLPSICLLTCAQGSCFLSEGVLRGRAWVPQL